VNPCRGSQASLVANLRAHAYADFVSFLLLQISFLGRELSSPPSPYLSDQFFKIVSPSLSWASQARRRPRATVQKPFQRRGEVLTKNTDKYRMLMPFTETGDPGCPMCMEPLLTILSRIWLMRSIETAAEVGSGSAKRGGDVTFLVESQGGSPEALGDL
jgi:hypothetical protein